MYTTRRLIGESFPVARQRWHVTLLVAATLFMLWVPTVAAEEATIVFQANLTVPVIGTAALGTLTVTVDQETGAGAWAFQGTLDGQFAVASGTGRYRFEGSTIRLTLTSIEQWQMPGIGQPSLPATATVRNFGNLAYVSYGPAIGVPVSISPPLTSPLQSGVYVLTEGGKGAEVIEALPNTGVAPNSADGTTSTLLATLIGKQSVMLTMLTLILIAGGLWLYACQHKDLPTAR